MRLLVYGGTLYAERRRIGDWPSSVSPQFLQGTAGLSELRPVYGVGILDDCPFVIFRIMLMHERRNYPFTVLLDPGERWKDFGWNGARLLWLLFDKVADKGSALIKEPESFQSEQDLDRLLTQVSEEKAQPPVPEDEAAEHSGEHFLHLWTGALTLERPLVMGFGDAELGLAERPREAEMARRLELLPLTLRGGLGWVMGGNEEYAAALGTKLIFDNSKTAEAGEDVACLVESGGEWLSGCREVEKKVEEGSIKDATLAELFSKPLAVWEREQRGAFPDYTTKDLLEDLSCIRHLLQGTSEQAWLDSSERLKVILDRQQRGPFNKTIEELYERLTSSAKQLDENGTRHYLRKLYDNGGALADLGLEESQLQEKTAVEFAVERGLYPSEGSVPQFIRFEVAKRLLQREEKAEDIPPRLRTEWNKGQLSDEQKRELRKVALERTVELPEGMSCWAEVLTTSESLEVASQVVWRHAVEGRATWNCDYLLFGKDPGGARLLEQHQALVQGVIGEAIKVLEEGDLSAPKLLEHARGWLDAAGRTEVRRVMSLRNKTYLADVGLENWRGLRGLRRRFVGDVAPQEVDPEEQKYLAVELRELSAGITSETSAPFLFDVIGLFDFPAIIKANVGMRETIDQLATLRPDLASEGGENWVRGWREIAARELISTHADRYWRKFKEDAAIFFAKSNQSEVRAFKLNELYDEGEDNPLKDLFSQLMFESEGDREMVYGSILSDKQLEIKKDEKVRQALQAALSEAISEGRSFDPLFRRLAPYEKVLETLRQILPDERQRARLASAEKEFRASKVKGYREQVFNLLTGKDGSPADADAFNNLKKSLSGGRKAEAELFDEAVGQAVADLLGSPHKVTFMERFGQNEQTIKAIKKCLPNVGIDQMLDEAIAEHLDERLRRDLDWYLCEGGKSDKLVEKLGKEKNPEVLTAACDAVMTNCLADGSKWKTVYDEVMLMTTRDGERKLRLSPKDPFVIFFSNLSPEVQQEVLLATYEQNRDRFHEMALHAYELRSKYDKALRENGKGETNPLRDAVLAFLLTKHGYAAKNKLLPSTQFRTKVGLDRYLFKLREFLPAGAEVNGQSAPESPESGEREQGATPKQGFRSWLSQWKKPGGQS